MPSALFSVLQVALATEGLLWFHTNFKAVYSVEYHWNFNRHCTESVDLRSMEILTILIFPIHEHRLSFHLTVFHCFHYYLIVFPIHRSLICQVGDEPFRLYVYGHMLLIQVFQKLFEDHQICQYPSCTIINLKLYLRNNLVFLLSTHQNGHAFAKVIHLQKKSWKGLTSTLEYRVLGLLEDNCFTMLCQFLLYKVNQLYVSVYIYRHIQLPFKPRSPSPTQNTSIDFFKITPLKWIKISRTVIKKLDSSIVRINNTNFMH